MNNPYPHLFSPITIGGVTFKNRIWSAPAGTHRLGDNGPAPDGEVIAYYAEKARGGTACITYSAQNMDLQREMDPYHAREDVIAPENHKLWRRLTDTVHFYGAKISLELLAFEYHGWQLGGRDLTAAEAAQHSGESGLRLVSYTVNGGGPGYPMLTREKMEEIADTYADAAEGALASGFDGILIHGGHGLVLSQMLSPKFNTRHDEFGGSLENRAKFPIMILDAIRARVGRKLLIEYRISGSELCDGGFAPEDCIAYLEMIQDKIDIAHVSAGSFYSQTEHIMHPTSFLPAGCNAYLARAVKESGKIHIPVLTLGGFQMPALMEETLRTGGADLIAMARGTIADPDMPQKAFSGREEEIRPCIRCFHCLDYGRKTAFVCSVNPRAGREKALHFLLEKPKEKKRVVVVGGGPAGLQAAIEVAGRGHTVTLLEKNTELGGKLTFSRQVSFKKNLEDYLDWLIRMAQRSGAEILCKAEATPEMVAELQPDAIIAAPGAEAYVPDLPGIRAADGESLAGNVLLAEACYTDAAEKLGQSIAVVGGGLVGCETALYLAQELGKAVILISRSRNIAADDYSIPRQALLEHMQASGIRAAIGAACIGANAEGALVRDSYGGSGLIPAESVVLATGMRPRKASAEAFRGISPFFETVGDSIKAGSVEEAVRTAFNAAVRI